MDNQQLQEEKIRLEIEKLKAELKNLRRPFWLSQGHYLLALSGAAALLVGVYQIRKTSYEFRLAELRKTEIQAETKKLENDRAQYESELATLKATREALTQENAKLGTQIAELSKYISRNRPTADEFNKQLEAIRAGVFPLRTSLPSETEGAIIGVSVETWLELLQDGRVSASTKVWGTSAAWEKIGIPGYRVTIFDINSEVPIYQFSLPSRIFKGEPFEPLRSSSTEGTSAHRYRYNETQDSDIRLPQDVVNKVFSTSQIRAEIERSSR